MTDKKDNVVGESFEKKIAEFQPKVGYLDGMVAVDIHLSELLKIGYQADKRVS